MEPLDPFHDFLVSAPASLDLLRPEDRALFHRHIRTCDDCAAEVRRHLDGIERMMREEEDPEVSEEQVQRVIDLLVGRGVIRPPSAGPRRLRLLDAWRSVPARVAAALLLFVGLAAGAAVAYTLARRPTTVIPMGGMDQVGFWEALGFPFEDLGVPADAVVEGHMSIPLPDGKGGTLFATKRPGAGAALRMLSFDETGNPLWDGGGLWSGVPGWNGGRGALLRGMKLVRVAPREGSRGEWAVWTAMLTTEGTWTVLTLFSPVTGEVALRFRHPGIFVHGGDMETLQVLPLEAGGGRPMLLGGRRGEGYSSIPVLVLLAPDGSVRQEVELPVTRPGAKPELHVSVLNVDHRSEPTLVHVDTHEGVHFQFPLKDGRLDIATVEVRFGDNLLKRIETDLGSREAYIEFMDERGGEDGILAGLAAGVRDVPREEFRGEVLR